MMDTVLLISGSSNRMGQEKALLPFSNDKNFVGHLVDVYSKIKTSTLYIIVNTHNEQHIKKAVGHRNPKPVFLINPNPENGRLSSILLGLNRMNKEKGVFIQNIDNPFIDEALINEMRKEYKSNAFLVPQFDGKNGHPLLLGAELVSELISQQQHITDLKSYLNTKKKNVLPTNSKAILANINTPKDYARWFSKPL